MIAFQDRLIRELDALVRELRERLPEAVPRWQLVDFHHAIEAAKPDPDPRSPTPPTPR